MKKFLSVIALSLVAVMLVSVLSSCGGNGDFVGTWKEVDSSGEPEANGDALVLANDGTGTISSSGVSGSLTWKVEDGKLTITASVCGMTETSKYAYEFSGDTMTLTDEDGDKTVFHKDK